MPASERGGLSTMPVQSRRKLARSGSLDVRFRALNLVMPMPPLSRELSVFREPVIDRSQPTAAAHHKPQLRSRSRPMKHGRLPAC